MSDQDRLLDHEYDGIQEFDNPLPGWWVYVFWASIIYSGFYWMYYEVGIGPTVHEEYGMEAVAVMDLLAEKYADLEVTEQAIAEKMADSTFMNGMSTIFKKKCATCHHTSGRGDACPNLTDDFWVHGGDLMQIYTTIRDGVAGKEMKSWQAELGPLKMLGMAAYVGTLRGKNVNGGRAPEGIKYDIKIIKPPEITAPPAGTKK